ncbi:hypothetical protein GQ55_4G115800 [Panicum hallii var. hallii]|uniref:Uncharacterized protein n=1 Tax=Panicum hallii var. hallii TaxID=1504633 RepID=A0A2T7DXN0_9POAL|nr:hypothetical protein GQ55_4G115800 [Panicum hallii var. hallii]
MNTQGIIWYDEYYQLQVSGLLDMMRAKMGKQNLDMLLDILPNQDNAFRRYSSTPTFLISTLPLS